MNTLSTAVETEIAKLQSGWCEVYDIYLANSISTPWGTTNILRISDQANDHFSFFTPKISPEDSGTQGDAATYRYWPIKRQLIKSDGKSANDKMQILASNVTAEWASMLSAVSWYDTPIVIRKVPLTISGATADDCAVIWSGQIDSVRVSEKQLTLECSNDMASLTTTAPRENMHTLCRFAWADDQCTKIRFHANHYKSKTVGTGSTTKIVKSSGLTEDSSSASSYGTDLVNALSDSAITASSEKTALTDAQFTLGLPIGSDLKVYVKNSLSNKDRVKFTGTTAPTNITLDTWYYVRERSNSSFKLSATATGDLIVRGISEGSSDLRITSEFGWDAFNVKSSKTSSWAFSDSSDWGTATQGFYQIPDAQAGLANAALKPYIQFDFGTSKQPKTWRISSIEGMPLEELVRLIAIFSSNDGSTWKHETYFEMPPIGGVLYDVLIPNASNARYWRICIRSRWATGLYFKLLGKVYAYESSRNFWARGRITFASDTTTAALRGISRRVEASYSGQISVAELPTAPVSGDTFVIERGCSRTFNACCERGNWENFGGFLDLPYQAVIR